MSLGNAKDGIVEAKRYSAAFPQSAQALGVRALFEAANGQDDAARSDAGLARARSSDNFHAAMVESYFKDMSERAEEDGRRPGILPWMKWGEAEACRHRREFSCARRTAEAAIRLQPDFSGPYVTLANALRADARLPEAQAVADRMMAAGAKDSDMLAVAGVIYCSTEQCPKGLAAFGASLAIKPTMTAYLNRIRYLPHADIAARRRDIDAALKIDPRSSAALTALANWQGEAEDQAGKAETWGKLATILAEEAGQDIQRNLDVGVAFARAGQQDKARERLAEFRGYATAMKNGTAFNDLCYSAAQANFDLDNALADCRRALAILPDAAPVLDSLGYVELRLGHFTEAIAAFDKALARSPALAPSLYGRGLARLRAGEKARGEVDLAAALKLDAAIADTYRTQGLKP